jgi:hypothetical protein
MPTRDERYRRDFELANRDRIRYRSVAIDAVAALLVRTGEDYGLLTGDDLADGERRAAELRARVRSRTG